MNCPHVQPGPQALLWFDLSTFHIRGSKPPCLLLLVVHSPRMVFQRIMRVDGHLAEESTDTFATCLSLRKRCIFLSFLSFPYLRTLDLVELE